MNDFQLQKDLRFAIKTGNIAKVNEIISRNRDLLNLQTPFGTWLHVASSKGKLAIVKKIIELGADVNAVGGVYGGNALNEAASAGHLDIVVYLLSCGAQMDISSPERNPLFGAISNGHFDIAKVLIENGIDTKVQYTGDSMNGMTALTFAKECGQTQIFKLLEDQMKESECSIVSNDSRGDEILRQVTQYFGPVRETINEIIPGSKVSITVHIIPAGEYNNFTVLMTTGMSDRPMEYSKEEGVYKYAELMIKLPASWGFSKEHLREKDYQWPISWLRKVAHIPHMYEGWIEAGVIIPNGEPPRSFSTCTELSSILIMEPTEKELRNIHTNERVINLFTLIPIYEEERKLAIEKGYQYLIDKMDIYGVEEVVKPFRVNVARE